MSGGPVIIADRLLVAASLLLVLLPGGICRPLLPRLIRPFNRLAILFLVAIMLLNGISLLIQPSSRFDRWLWSLALEYNVASTLSSTLLAINGGALVAVAWLARKKNLAFGIYFLLIGLTFLYLSLDEYHSFKNYLANWNETYSVLGVAIVIATAIAARHAPSPARSWLKWWMIGLATSAAGAIALDLLPGGWERIGPFQLDGKWPTVHIEELLELMGYWLMLVAALGLLSDSGPVSPPIIRIVAIALPAVWLLSFIVHAFIPRWELQIMSEPADVRFEASLRLQGYRINQLDDKVVLQLYASSKQGEYIDQGFTVRLIDQVTGEWVSSHDSWSNKRRMVWILGADYEQVYRQHIEIALTPTAPTNRALWIVLFAWRNGPSLDQRQRILSSDHEMLNETQIVLAELAIPAASQVSFGAPLATFDSSFSLGAVALPQHARAGETMRLEMPWRADAAGSDEYIQFLHFGHIESGEWWVYDQQPLGRRLPTRLWYSGLTDSEVWEAPLSADLASGEYAVYTGLYRLSDQERVPVKGRDGRLFVDARVPLGFLTLE